MRFMTWNESLSVHVEEIDAQHQWLTDIINTLHEELSENRGKRLLEIVVESLIQYVRLHFETEQGLMIKYKYPGYEEHKAKHDILGQKVMDWNRQLGNGEADLTLEMVKFLKEWLENHEVNDDGPLGVYLNARGVK
jgi:hemerythrin